MPDHDHKPDEVITDAGAFGAVYAGAHRFADRPTTPAYTPPEEEEEEKPRLRGWSDKPSIRGQISVAPDSVKVMAPVTEVLVLSREEDLKKLNLLQAQASDESGPFVAIVETDRQFHKGEWHVCITYAKIAYQIL